MKITIFWVGSVLFAGAHLFFNDIPFSETSEYSGVVYSLMLLFALVIFFIRLNNQMLLYRPEDHPHTMRHDLISLFSRFDFTCFIMLMTVLFARIDSLSGGVFFMHLFGYSVAFILLFFPFLIAYFLSVRLLERQKMIVSVGVIIQSLLIMLAVLRDKASVVGEVFDIFPLTAVSMIGTNPLTGALSLGILLAEMAVLYAVSKRRAGFTI